jgi:hypothetical protein
VRLKGLAPETTRSSSSSASRRLEGKIDHYWGLPSRKKPGKARVKRAEEVKGHVVVDRPEVADDGLGAHRGKARGQHDGVVLARAQLAAGKDVDHYVELLGGGREIGLSGAPIASGWLRR